MKTRWEGMITPPPALRAPLESTFLSSLTFPGQECDLRIPIASDEMEAAPISPRLSNQRARTGMSALRFLKGIYSTSDQGGIVSAHKE